MVVKRRTQLRPKGGLDSGIQTNQSAPVETVILGKTLQVGRLTVEERPDDSSPGCRNLEHVFTS